eukprot:5502166-Ditylum_brightwellii.AAC.1
MYFGKRFQGVEMEKELGKQVDLEIEKVRDLPEVGAELDQSIDCQTLPVQVDPCDKDEDIPWRDVPSSNNRTTRCGICHQTWQTPQAGDHG